MNPLKLFEGMDVPPQSEEVKFECGVAHFIIIPLVLV